MRGSWTRIGRAVAGGTIVLAAAGIPIAGMPQPGALALDVVEVTKGAVIVEVANPTPYDVRATVVLSAVTSDGRALEATASVSAPKGTTVPVSIPIGTTAVVVELGVVLDDGVPF